MGGVAPFDFYRSNEIFTCKSSVVSTVCPTSKGLFAGSIAPRLEQIELTSLGDRLRAVGHHKLGKDMFDMELDRVLTDD